MNPIYTAAILSLVVSSVFSMTEFKDNDAELVCTNTGMKVKFNKTVLDLHKRPYKIHFLNTNVSSCIAPHNTTTNLMSNNETIWLQANFNQCAIAVHQEQGSIVYKQTVAVTYGTNPKSSLVFREEKILFEARCTKSNNFTVVLDGEYLNVTALQKMTFNKTNTAEFKISLKRTNQDFITEDKSATQSITSLMYFKIELETSRSELIVSPQSCYAHPANNLTLKYYLIKNRCPNPVDPTIQISNTDERQAVFLWQNQAFRFFGQSADAVYVSCDVVICASNASAACQRCGVTNRARRDISTMDASDQENVETARVTSPLIVLVDKQRFESEPKSLDDTFNGPTGTVILTLLVVLSVVGSVLLVKKLFLNGDQVKEDDRCNENKC